MFETPANELELQINVLKQQIELEESNYKYAVELNKPVDILIFLRQHILEQKKILYELVQTATQFKHNTTSTL